MKHFYFSANQAQPQQLEELAAFSKKLDELDKAGDNKGFARVIGEISEYQLKEANSNIWGAQFVNTCCDGRNGALHKELRDIATHWKNSRKPQKAANQNGDVEKK
jgi:hypothetical protein